MCYLSHGIHKLCSLRIGADSCFTPVSPVPAAMPDLDETLRESWAWKRGNHVQEQVLKGLLQVTVLSAWFQVSTPFWLSQLNTHYPSLRGVKSSTVWESQLEVCEASDKGFSSSDRRRETWLAFYVLPSFSLEFRRTAFLNGAAAAILSSLGVRWWRLYRV